MAPLHVWLQFKVPLHMLGLRFCEDPPAGSLITPYIRGLLGAGWVGGLVVWGLLSEQALVLCACRERASELGIATFAPEPFIQLAIKDR